MSDESMAAMKKAAEEGGEFVANQQAQYAAEQAAEAARFAAAEKGYPRIMSSGGARDDTTVYPSVFQLEYDTEAEAVAAIDQAKAEGRYVAPGVDKTAGGWQVGIELDPSTRYPLADHTGGR